LTAEVDPPRWARPVVVLPVFVVISAVGGALPSFSLGANLLVLAVGGALFRLGLSRTLPRRRAPRRLSRAAAWWLLPAFCFACLELTDFALGSTYPHPTLSVLADPVLAHYLARALAYLGWLLAYWGLVRR